MTRLGRRGGGLGEALVTLALASLLLAGAASVSGRILRRARAPAAARAAASELRRARAEAVSRQRNVGLRFERLPGGAWSAELVEDGDGDGIRTADIRRGIDRVREGPWRVRDRWGVEPGFVRGLTSLRSPPPDQQPLGSLDDPLRFGSTDIVSCSPRGTITPGTIYLTDGLERQFAVVAYGSTARVRVWEYVLPRGEWVLR